MSFKQSNISQNSELSKISQSHLDSSSERALVYVFFFCFGKPVENSISAIHEFSLGE